VLAYTSLDRYYTTDQFWYIFPFLAGFFVLFSTITFIHQLLEGISASVLELVLLLLNAAIFFGFGYKLITEAYASYWSAALTLSLSAFYTGHLYLFMSRKRRDRNLALGFIALAAFFLIITLPLLLSEQWLTLSWSLQAFVLLWLAAKLESRFLRYVSYVLYTIVVVRFFVFDLTGQFGAPLAADTTLKQYALLLLERLVSFGVPVASIALAMRLHTSPATAAALSLGKDNDVGELIPQKPAIATIATLLFGMLFVYLHLEINRTMMYIWNPVRLPVLTMLWVGAAIFVLALHARIASQALFALFIIFVVGALVKLFIFDFAAWDIVPDTFSFHTSTYSFLEAGMRLLDVGVILGFLIYAFMLLRKRKGHESPYQVFGYAALCLFLFYMTFELNTFLGHFVPGLQAGGISVFWGLFALSLLTGGIIRNVRAIRLSGLTIFLVAAIKVIVYDLNSLDQLYRIIAFILLGIVLLAGAYVYITFESKLKAENQANDKEA
jgi:uncharacterized membrane protein